MANFLDRGDLDAVPDPSWNSQWACWAPWDIESYIAASAAVTVLTLDQAATLLQGLPPAFNGWPITKTVLAEFEGIVQRLRDDAGRGIISNAPTPEELAAWCDARRHPLPGCFFEALRKAAASNVPGPLKQSVKTIALPPWAAPLALAAAPPPPATRAVGRPRTAQPTHDALVKAADQLLMERAAAGVVTTLPEIAKLLACTPLSAGMWECPNFCV